MRHTHLPRELRLHVFPQWFAFAHLTQPLLANQGRVSYAPILELAPEMQQFALPPYEILQEMRLKVHIRRCGMPADRTKLSAQLISFTYEAKGGQGKYCRCEDELFSHIYQRFGLGWKDTVRLKPEYRPPKPKLKDNQKDTSAPSSVLTNVPEDDHLSSIGQALHSDTGEEGNEHAGGSCENPLYAISHTASENHTSELASEISRLRISALED